MEKNSTINVRRTLFELSAGPLKWRYEHRQDRMEKEEEEFCSQDMETSFRVAAETALNAGMTPRELEEIISGIETGATHGNA